MKTTRTVVYGPGNSTTTTISGYSNYTENGFQPSMYNGRGHDVNGGGADRRSKSGSGTKPSNSEPKRSSGPPMKIKGMTFDEVRKQCLKENRLFEDPDFPATNSSICPGRRSSRPFEWQRPSVSNVHCSRNKYSPIIGYQFRDPPSRSGRGSGRANCPL